MFFSALTHTIEFQLLINYFWVQGARWAENITIHCIWDEGPGSVFFLRKIPQKKNNRFFLEKRREAPRFFFWGFCVFFGEISAKRRFLKKNGRKRFFFWEKSSFFGEKRFLFFVFFVEKFKFQKNRFFLEIVKTFKKTLVWVSGIDPAYPSQKGSPFSPL